MYNIIQNALYFIALTLILNNVIPAQMQANIGFDICTVVPGKLYVQEQQVNGTQLLNIANCYNNSVNLNVNFRICSGNDKLKDADSGYKEPFLLTAGILRTNVIFNLSVHRTFSLCIQALTESEECQVDACNDVNNIHSLSLEIVIKDKEYYVPTFSGKIVGISGEAPYHSPVIQVTTIDNTRNIIYNIANILYKSHTGTLTEKDDIFIINNSNGLIRTNQVHLLDYTNGYFVVKIEVIDSDSQEKIDTPIVNIFVVRDSQIQRMTLKLTPRKVTDIKSELISQINHALGLHMVVNNLRYHILKNSDGSYDGRFDNTKTDMCFHMIRKKIAHDTPSSQEVYYIMEPKDVQNIFIEYKDNLTKIVNDYSIVKTEDEYVKIESCEIKLETYLWSNQWWLWWLIVAEAIFIFLVAFILIIALCYCYRRAKDNLPRTNAYTILDPFVIPYQYIEKTAKM